MSFALGVALAFGMCVFFFVEGEILCAQRKYLDDIISPLYGYDVICQYGFGVTATENEGVCGRAKRITLGVRMTHIHVLFDGNDRNAKVKEASIQVARTVYSSHENYRVARHLVGLIL